MRTPICPKFIRGVHLISGDYDRRLVIIIAIATSVVVIPFGFVIST